MYIKGAMVILAGAALSVLAAQPPQGGSPAVAGKPASSQAATSAGTQAASRPVVKVKTAEEFVKAIGPDRIIQLEPGEYNLTGIKQARLKHVRWDKAHDGYDLTIRDVKGLRIEGLGDKKVRIVVEPSYTYVLAFENAQGVELVNLEMGHLEEGYCTGGVVKVASGKDFAIRGCDLYGCGMEGLTLEKTSGLVFEKSTIRDCSYGIMTVEGCEKLRFTDSVFKDNRKYHGFVLHDSEDIEFRNCRIENNSAGEALFQAASCSKLAVKGGSIQGNTYKKMADPSESVTVEKTEIRNNTEPSDL